MTAPEMQALRDRVKEYAADGRFELYKLSLRFDNPEARQQAFAQNIITELRNRHHTRYYVWHLEAAKPSD